MLHVAVVFDTAVRHADVIPLEAQINSRSVTPRASRQGNGTKLNAPTLFRRSSVLLAGRTAAVGYSAVVIVVTPTGSRSTPACIPSAVMAQAKSYQLAVPASVQCKTPRTCAISAIRQIARAIDTAQVGEPRWSAMTRTAPRSRISRSIVSRNFLPWEA